MNTIVMKILDKKYLPWFFLLLFGSIVAAHQLKPKQQPWPYFGDTAAAPDTVSGCTMP